MPRPLKRSPEVVLAALRHAQAEIGMPPTIEELRDRLQVGSTRTVLRYLQTLEAKGWITRWPGARGIRINAPDGWQPEASTSPAVMMVSGDVDLDDPEIAEAMEDIRQAGAKRLARRESPADD